MTALNILIISIIILFCLIFLKFKKGYLSPYYFFLILFLIGGYVRCSFYINSGCFEKELEKKELVADFTGTVYKIKEKEYGYSLYVNNVKVTIDGKTKKTKNLILNYDHKINSGCKIKFGGKASLFEQPCNPGEFNLREYYSTIGIGYKVKADNLKIINSNGYIGKLMLISNEVKDSLSKITDATTASVFYAMLLGDKDELKSEIMDAYSDCGIGHILAISGLHISIIGMSLYRLLRRTGIKYKGSLVISAIFIVSYGIMTGNGISTIRASIMFIISIYAETVEKTYDTISALGLTSILMLLRYPLLVFNCGFELSFIAVLGVVSVNEKILRSCHVRNKVISAIISGISIQLATLPIIMYWYYCVPVYSFILNLIVIPLMTIVMISATAGGVFGLASYYMGRIAIGPAVYIIRFFSFLCDIYLKIPNSVIITGRPEIWQILLYYIGSYFVLFLISKKGKLRFLLGIIPFLIIIILRFNNYLEVDFLYVGQGDGAFIRTENGTTILIDSGSSDNDKMYEYSLEPFLMSKGVSKIDYAIVSHTDMDHVNGIMKILENDKIKIANLYLPQNKIADENYKKIYELAFDKKVCIKEMYRGIKINEGKFNMECLYPGTDSAITDKNDFSNVIYMRYKNTSVLFTGDISKKQEMELGNLLDGDKITILKAAHHGSNTANCLEFLQKIEPDVVVISCGKNNSYGHPSKETLDNLNRIDCKIRRTDLEGAVSYKFPK